MTTPAAAIVRDAVPADFAAIAAIYNHYIRESIATFEETLIDAAEIGRRVAAVKAAELPWIVAEEESKILGYAYATGWRPRSAYRYSVEATVYLDPDAGGRGLGTLLYGELFPLLRARGIHVVIGGISLPNAASVALHEKFGMRKVAHFERVGYKFDRWIDVGYWQCTFEIPDPRADDADETNAVVRDE